MKSKPISYGSINMVERKTPFSLNLEAVDVVLHDTPVEGRVTLILRSNTKIAIEKKQYDLLFSA